LEDENSPHYDQLILEILEIHHVVNSFSNHLKVLLIDTSFKQVQLEKSSSLSAEFRDITVVQEEYI
jgi:hypothetical protein